METNPIQRRTRVVLTMMALLQVLWLGVIAWTRSSNHPETVPWLIAYSVGVGAAMLFLPAAVTARLELVLTRWIQNPKLFLGLLCCIAGAIGLVYARTQRIWPFDEESSLFAARFIANFGLDDFFAVYENFPWLGMQHPPLMFPLYGAMVYVFGDDPFYARWIPLGLMLATLVLTWALARDLFTPTLGVFAATLLLAFPIIVRQGAAAMLDMAVTFFFTLALWLVLRLQRAPSLGRAALLGGLVGMGLLSKYTMLFIVPVCMSVLLVLVSFRRIKWHLGLALVIALALVGLWIAFAFQAGILQEQSQRLLRYTGMRVPAAPAPAAKSVPPPGAAPFYNLSVPSFVAKFLEARYQRHLLETFVTRLPSAIGVANLPLLVLGAWVTLKRRRVPDIFLWLWIAVVSVGVIILLPDHRYFIPTFPALAMVMARGVHAARLEGSRVLLLALLLNLAALYLFVDWSRTAGMF